MHTFMILHVIIRVKSSLSKSIMQQSIYPIGRRWPFSTSQVYYTAESIRAVLSEYNHLV